VRIVSKVQATSSAVIGGPSWKRASGRRWKTIQPRSAGSSTLSQTRQYLEKGSSAELAISVSMVALATPAGTPPRIQLLKLSKVPTAWNRTSPPFGASGLA